MGSGESARDVQLYDLLVDEVAFVGSPMVFTAKLKTYGFKGNSVRVTLKQKDSTKILDSKAVMVENDGQPVNLELTWIPAGRGRNRLHGRGDATAARDEHRKQRRDAAREHPRREDAGLAGRP